MRKVPLYSSSTRTRAGPGRDTAAAPGDDASRREALRESLKQTGFGPPDRAAMNARREAARQAAAAAAAMTVVAPTPPSRRRRMRAWIAAHDRPLLVVLGAALALALVALDARLAPAPQVITQEDIDAAVKHTIEKTVLPSQRARAYQAIRPSVVRVRGLADKKEGDKEVEQGVGSGVVVVEDGTILTNLHVVAGAKRIGVVFADGLESDAVVIATQPENDLAVIKAKVIPDDLQPATLRSTADLSPGDHVTAVGFPFGIGPSVSSGVVSGLRREFRSPEGQRVLSNLIQFDAAANPGSSGGPLVTDDGAVVGIVTGILNPNEQRVFIGIGFAVPIENAASAVGMSPF